MSHYTHLLFVDPRVVHYASLLNGLSPNTEIIFLNLEEDGVSQMTQVLSQKQNLDSIQILSHGGMGRIHIGTTDLGLENLNQYEADLAQWSQALHETGDILLLGCDVAAGEGQDFIQRLSAIIGADIAASNDVTGSANQGGDWDLEVQMGTVEAPIALAAETMQAYTQTLGVIRVTNANDSGSGSLRQAILDANSSSGFDVIDLTGISGQTIILNSSLPTITDELAIDGDENNRVTLDGKQQQIIAVNTGGEVVTFSGLNFLDGLAQGGDGSNGSNGGGGGLGAGGAIVAYTGRVAVDRSGFTNNKAQGGNATGTAGSGGADGQIGGSGGVGGSFNRTGVFTFAGVLEEA